jgi:hypothetical protein
MKKINLFVATSTIFLALSGSAQASLIEINSPQIDIKITCSGIGNKSCYRETYQTVKVYEQSSGGSNCNQPKGCTVRTGGSQLIFIRSYKRVVSRVRVS